MPFFSIFLMMFSFLGNGLVSMDSGYGSLCSEGTIKQVNIFHVYSAATQSPTYYNYLFTRNLHQPREV